MMLTSFISALVAIIEVVSLVAPVSAAPYPDAAKVVATAVVEGLPLCSKPIMNQMVLRAPNFGCENANGTPNITCLCLSKPFKRLAKAGILAGCHHNADIGTTREWVIDRCTAAITAANDEAAADLGVSRIASNSTSVPERMSESPAAIRAPGNAPTGIKSTLPALTVPLFDIDDDEDRTAGVTLVRPVAREVLFATLLAGTAVLL